MPKKCIICKNADFTGICKASTICGKKHFYKCPNCGKLFKVKKVRDFYVIRKRLCDKEFIILEETSDKVIFAGESKWYWDIVCRDCANDNRDKVTKMGQQKVIETSNKRYGVDNPAQAPEIKEKKKKTTRERYGVDYPLQNKTVLAKAKATLFEHYGVEHPTQSAEVREQMIERCRKETGYDWPAQTPEGKEKIRAGHKRNTGYDYPMQNPETHRKASLAAHKNGNRSSFEDMIVDKLKELDAVEHIDFEQEYYDKARYPFHCDFYFPKTDTFLEINGYWMHNKHFFDEDDPDDQKCLKQWKKKAESSDAYKVAIESWTECDPEKHATALENNLNYVVLWTRQEVKDFCVHKLIDLV